MCRICATAWSQRASRESLWQGRYVSPCAVGMILSRDEDFATTEEVGIDGVRARAKKTERDGGRQRDDRRGPIEARHHCCADRDERHKRVAQTDDCAAHGREE